MEEKTKVERLLAIRDCFKHLQETCKPVVNYYYGEPYNIYNWDAISSEANKLNNQNDAIILSQISNHALLTNDLVKSLNLSIKEKFKYNALKKKNQEINHTLNFELLGDKYDFLWDEMQLLSLDINVQAQILSLDDDRLSWFGKLFQNAQAISTYPAKYISNILSAVGYCPFLEDKIQDDLFYWRYKKSAPLCHLLDDYAKNQPLTKSELDNLVFLLGTNAGVEVSKFIADIKDLDNLFDKNNPIQKHFAEKLEQTKIANAGKKPSSAEYKKNVETLKEIVFCKFFGLKYGESIDCDIPRLLDKFNIEGLNITHQNERLLKLYSLIGVVNSLDNFDQLMDINDFLDKSDFTPSYLEMATFENLMREEYAKQTNDALLSLDNLPKKRIGNAIVYDAGIDFKMLVTAVGSYQDLKHVGNYSNYWNSDYLRSHGNCCSLISNCNLATAKQTGVVFGFLDMPKEALLAGSNRDANSTPHNRNYDINYHNRNQVFYSPSELINHTRDYYNELVYERIDVSQKGKYFKKNPDYIVFFEEFEDIDKEIKERKKNYCEEPCKNASKKGKKQKNKEKKSDESLLDVDPLVLLREGEKERWEESVKASVQLGIPIVKINRETCAKSESKKIQEALHYLQETDEPSLIKDIIVRYLNNYTGLRDMENTHWLLREKYFSKEGFTSLQKQIENIIANCDNKQSQKDMLTTFHEALFDEESLNVSSGIPYAFSYDDATLNRLSKLEEKVQSQ